MAHSKTKYSCTILIILCSIVQLCSAGGLFSSMVEGLAVKTSEVSNGVANLKTAKVLTDTGTYLGDGALKVLTGGRVQDASAYTSFLFFCRESGGDYTQVDVGDSDTLLNAGFSVTKPTKIIIHGWTTNGTDSFPERLGKAFLRAADLNVISVNWARFAQSAYSVAYTAVPYVGAYTATFVDFLVQTMGVDLSSIHLVGFSLGAHTCGIAGESVTCGKLPRISGLDPAGPLFTSTTNGSLDATDAEFVDVIHTTAGTIGYADPCGTVDFYPNGGYAPQPGCSPLDPFCSHGQAYQFYAESLASDGFLATACKDWKSYEKGECADSETAVMGYNVDKRSKGVFYLETNSESPYAKGY